MLLVLISLGAILVAGLLTLPLAKSAGPGRVAAFAVLAILGVAGALWLTTSDVLPSLDTEKAEEAREMMIDDLEKQAGVPVTEAPSIELLDETEGPTVWRLEGVSVLCVPKDFPDSAEMVCWVPDVMVAEGMKVGDHEGDDTDETQEGEPEAPQVPDAVDPNADPDAVAPDAQPDMVQPSEDDLQ